MKLIIDDIAKSVRYRKKARSINRVVMTNEIGEESLAFIAEAVKEIEWDTVRIGPEEDCDCFGCEISDDCEKLEYRYKLNLETMDLARLIPETGSLFEYIDFNEDPEEIDGALVAIWTHLNHFEEE